MGIVYKAVDRVLGRTVAIKTIRRELVSKSADYRAYRDRFFREARIFGSLSHPSIVALYDIGETKEEIPFLAMQYVPHPSLAELGRRLSLDQSMWLLAQLASALDYAHSRGVIHRDIKPSNVLVGEGEEVKVADFGVAKLLGTEFTRSQTQFGTPGYMSPEQVLGTEIAGSADIFSLGVVAFELLSETKPFPGRDVHAVLHKIVHTNPVLPAGLEDSGLVSEKWQNVFSKALAKDPQKRHRTASALVSELVELCPGSWLGDLIESRPDTATFRFTELDDADTLTLWGLGASHHPGRSGVPGPDGAPTTPLATRDGN